MIYMIIIIMQNSLSPVLMSYTSETVWICLFTETAAKFVIPK